MFGLPYRPKVCLIIVLLVCVTNVLCAHLTWYKHRIFALSFSVIHITWHHNYPDYYCPIFIDEIMHVQDVRAWADIFIDEDGTVDTWINMMPSNMHGLLIVLFNMYLMVSYLSRHLRSHLHRWQHRLTHVHRVHAGFCGRAHPSRRVRRNCHLPASAYLSYI